MYLEYLVSTWLSGRLGGENDVQDHENSIVIELLILMTAVMAPFFILANEVSGDEMLKASAGIFLAAATATVITAYKVWKGSNG